MRPLLFLLLATPALAAPRVQPDLPDGAERFTRGTVVSTDAPDAWWTAFGDPALDALVVEALESNADLGAAQARMNQSAGVTLQTLSPLLPTASFDVGLNASPTANNTFQLPPNFSSGTSGIGDLASDFYQSLGVLRATSPPEIVELLPELPEPEDDVEEEEDPDVTWNGSALFNFGLNIDLGRSAAAFRASQFDAAAAKGDRDAAARIIVQQVVAAWLDVRNARERVALVENQIATNSNLLELTRRRFEAAQASGLDVLQQQQQTASTRALLPQAQQLLRLREVQLATLLGRDPNAPDLPEGVGNPALPATPGVGTPRDLLDNRPDLQAANARFQGGKARTASAGLAFAPTFRLSGNVGWQLRWFNEWDSAETWGFGAGVSVPIFSGLQRHGALRATAAAQDAAAWALTGAVRQARAEVESALTLEETNGDRLAALAEQLLSARTAYEEATRQYAAGQANYLTVLTSLGSFQIAELNHLQAQRDLLGARVDLHTALGSRWARRLD